MIEGIVGIFVILLLILVVPYIKDYFNKQSSTTSVNGEVHHKVGDVTYKFSVFADKKPPAYPSLGMSWLNTNDSKIYVWNGQVWQLRVETKEGDLWLW